MARTPVRASKGIKLLSEYQVIKDDSDNGGYEGRRYVTSQGTPNPALITDLQDNPEEFVSSNDVLTTPGGRFIISPSTFDGTNFGSDIYARLSIHAKMWLYAHQPLEHLGGDDYQGPPHLVKNSDPAFDIEIEIDGVPAPSGDVTVDYETGVIEVLNVPSGDEEKVTLYGYYYRFTTNAFSDYVGSTYKQDGETMINYILLNPAMQNWDGTSAPYTLRKWNVTGTVTRESTDKIAGNYYARLSAGAGSSSSIDQTITIPASISQATFIVVLKTDNFTTIQISMDSGSTWAPVDINISAHETLENKWCVLYVSSLINSTTTIMVKIIATGSGGNTVQTDVACCALVNGGI